MKIKTNNIRATLTKRMLSTGLSALLTLSPVYIHAHTDIAAVTAFVNAYFGDKKCEKFEACKVPLEACQKNPHDQTNLVALATALSETAPQTNVELETYITICLLAICNSDITPQKKADYVADLNHALKTGNIPNRYLEAIKRSLTENFSSTLSEVATAVGMFGTMSTLMIALQNMRINGNALDDLKKAARQNSKKYPTLTWRKLQSNIPEIRKELESNLAGQTKAINKIIDQLHNHCNYLEICERNGQKPKRSLVLHFYGAPGVGKSTALRIISEKLGIGVLTFGMSSAVEDNGKRANTVLARLMNPDVIDTRVTKAYFKTPLRKAIENPGTMIIGFDEIEKMRKLDAQISKCDYRNDEKYIAPSSLDEAMRDVKDQGMFAGFDVSDKIFVTISNETEESLNELEPSFRDRLMGSLVYFKQFGIEDYKELIEKSSKSLFEAYGKDGITLSWSDEALDHYAREFHKEHYSGRRVVEFIDSVGTIVKDSVGLLNYEPTKNNLKLDYDSSLATVIVSPVTNDLSSAG